MSDDTSPNATEPAAMTEPVIITLRKPVTLEVRTGGGTKLKTVTEITIRPPKGKDLRRVDRTKSPIAISLDMASWLSGEPPQIIDELEGADLREVLKVVDDFFVAIQATGKEP